MNTGTTGLPEPGRYRAFISYSHADGQWGNWLHKALETYRVPKALIGLPSRTGPIPRRLYPIFRDREELPTATSLSEQIEQALTYSDYLIVICSPRSAKSRWVNQEILQFKRLGRSDRILAMIVDGEPNASDIPGKESDECFPPALRFELTDDGELSDRPTEPIAADAREGRDGKRKACLKLIAGLLGIGFDKLAQREQHRQRQRRLMAIAIVAIAVVVGCYTGWEIYQARRQAQQEAARVHFSEAQRLMATEASYWNGVDQLTKAVLRGIPPDHPGLASAVRGVFERRRDWTQLHMTPAPLHVGMSGTTYNLGAPRTHLVSRTNESEVREAALDASGRIGVSLLRDGGLWLWDFNNEAQKEFVIPDGASISWAALSANGQKLARILEEGAITTDPHPPRWAWGN